jgi:transketolase
MEKILDNIEMRQAYCQGMIQAAEADDRIVLLEADLTAGTGTAPFKAKFSDRHINVGIAEANMVGIAAGLASCGKLPFVHSFTPFATRRCFDQIAVSVALTGLNVKIVGTDPGIMATNNGASHTSLEDVGIMRSLPTMTIFEPADAQVLKAALPQIIAYPKPMYIRMFRKAATTVFNAPLPADFNIFKASVLSEGKQVTIVATGIMVHKALAAAEKLKEFNIQAGVICVHTTKPLDTQTIIDAAKKTGAVVVAENHNIYGGLGSAVCEALAENYPVPVKRVGVQDRFGEVGNEEYLTKIMKLDVLDIIIATNEVLKMKK